MPVFGVIPATPSSSQQFTITVGAPNYQALSAAATLQGNSINVVLMGVPVFFVPAPPTSCSTTAPVGPLPAGIYTVVLSVVDPSSPPAPPTFIASSTLTVTGLMARISYQVLPSAPSSLEAVRLRTTFSGGEAVCYYDGLRSMSGNKITVTLICFSNLFGLPSMLFDVDLGRFPPGDYTMEVVSSDTKEILFSTAFSVTDPHAGSHFPFNYPAVDYTDHWWNAQESGWGISIMQHPSDRLFAVWFVYNQSGQPVWYTLQGSWITPAQFTGPVYRTMGPYFGGLFDPSQVGITQVGTGTLYFPDANSGRFSYTVEGVSGTKLITRLPF